MCSADVQGVDQQAMAGPPQTHRDVQPKLQLPPVSAPRESAPRAAETVNTRPPRWIMEACRARHSARRATSASGFDMDVGVVFLLMFLAFWLSGIGRVSSARHTHPRV